MGKSGPNGAAIGRPTDCTPELTEDVCNAIREVGSLEAAAAEAGISYRSVFQWRRKGREEPETVFAAFLHATDSARSEWSAAQIKGVLAAADEQTVEELSKAGDAVKLKKPGDWRARLAIMERIRPENFAVGSKVFQAKHLLMFLDTLGVTPSEDQVVSLIGEMFQVDAAKAANITAKALDSKDKQAALDLLKRFKQGGTNGRQGPE